MLAPLKVLFVEPPPERRVGGIETALKGLETSLPAAQIFVTRTDAVEQQQIAETDLVHFHGLWEPMHLRARRWCAHAGKPFLVSPHGMLEDWALRHRGWKKRPYFHFVERPSLRRGRALLATSEAEAGTLRRWFDASQIRVLPLGGTLASVTAHGDARHELGWPDGEFVILFLSRCHEKKGLHLLIAAVPEVARATHHRVHLVIVGDGEPAYVEPLRAASQGWSGNLRATWIGACWSPAKWNYLSGADLVCLPSYSENFGLVVLEGLFAGTPILTTPATPWGVLRGALPVQLTAPEVPALVAALREQIAAPRPTPEERARTQQASAARFDWRVLASRYGSLYRELAVGI
jgi:glycosyltransferase involved in cell wall biosynthesis